jgi:hypothetical protein
MSGVSPALIAIAAIALVGCGSSSTTSSPPGPSPAPATCESVYGLLGLPPSAIADSEARHQCVQQDLEVSGEISGSIRAGHLSALGGAACVKPVLGADLGGGPRLDVDLGGRLFMLTIRLSGQYRGDASTPIVDVRKAVELATADSTVDYTATAGTMSMDASGYSGAVDLDLQRDVAGAHPVHITGTWSCGPPPLAPSPTSTDPCVDYATLVGLPSPGPGESAAPCVPQDLTFTGGLSFSVKQALGGLSRTTGISRACGGTVPDDTYSYYSTQSFAAAGSAYQLSFEISHDRSAGPVPFPSFGPTYVYSSGRQPNPTLSLRTGLVTWESTAGTFVVASDHRSGSVDMDLRGGLDANQTVHVSGSWRCGQ